MMDPRIVWGRNSKLNLPEPQDPAGKDMTIYITRAEIPNRPAIDCTAMCISTHLDIERQYRERKMEMGNRTNLFKLI